MAYASLILVLFLSLLGFFEFYVEARHSRKNKERNYDFRETFSNLAVYNQDAFSWLLVIPVFFLYEYLFSHSKQWHVEWTGSGVLTWLIALIITDFVFYIFHVLSHHANVMWGAHLVHHQPEYFNFTVGGRAGFFEKPILYFMMLPLALTGLPSLTVFSATAFGRGIMGWLHTRTIGKLGILEYFLNTPSHHRVHHYKDIARLGGTKNYGGVFIFWDRIFGTFSEEEGEHKYGVAGIPTIYSPFKSHTFFYAHLCRQFFKVPLKHKAKLLFTGYLAEPVPMRADESKGPISPFSYRQWVICFLLLTLTYQGNHILAGALPLARGEFDVVHFVKLSAAGGAILFAIFQMSKILEGKEGLQHRVVLALTLVATLWAYVFFSQQQLPGNQEKGVVSLFLEARTLLAAGALFGLR